MPKPTILRFNLEFTDDELRVIEDHFGYRLTREEVKRFCIKAIYDTIRLANGEENSVRERAIAEIPALRKIVDDNLAELRRIAGKDDYHSIMSKHFDDDIKKSGI